FARPGCELAIHYHKGSAWKFPSPSIARSQLSFWLEWFHRRDCGSAIFETICRAFPARSIRADGAPCAPFVEVRFRLSLTCQRRHPPTDRIQPDRGVSIK